jgi:non-specific protein-tyrosine kinase
MISKIREVIMLFNKRLNNRKEETSGVSLQSNSEEKYKEKSKTDKIGKAILYFKRRQNGKEEETPDISLQNISEEKDEEKSVMDKTEKEMLYFKRRQSGKQEKIPDVSLQNIPEETPDISLQGKPQEKDKEKFGWVSPAYSQSRTIHLDPGFMEENHCLAYLDNVPEAEAYRVLRTQILQRTKDSGSNTIMVTSALPGEGKTLAAINLAFTFAREFQHTVLLVDGDLRKQSIHKYLGYASEKGLIDYLADGVPVSELITWPGIEKMALISGGRSFQESAEILGSPRMKELISDMKRRYPDRYIIFDVPPILTGADALTFAPLVDNVVVIVRAGKTSMDDVKKALQFLPKEKILGLVLNRC